MYHFVKMPSHVRIISNRNPTYYIRDLVILLLFVRTYEFDQKYIFPIPTKTKKCHYKGCGVMEDLRNQKWKFGWLLLLALKDMWFYWSTDIFSITVTSQSFHLTGHTLANLMDLFPCFLQNVSFILSILKFLKHIHICMWCKPNAHKRKNQWPVFMTARER